MGFGNFIMIKREHTGKKKNTGAVEILIKAMCTALKKDRACKAWGPKFIWLSIWNIHGV